MAQVPVAPFVLKDATLLVGADNYEGHCSQVQFDPTVAQQSWQGMTPAASFTDVSNPTWAATLAVAQDWKTPNSLSQYLYDHQGETVTAQFVTNPGAGTWEADLIIAPGSIGGPVNAYAVQQVTLGISGQPRFTPAPVIPLEADEPDELIADPEPLSSSTR